MTSRSHRLFRRFFLAVIVLLALPLGIASVWRASPAGHRAAALDRCMARGWIGPGAVLDWAPASGLTPPDRQARAAFCAADLDWRQQPARRAQALAAMVRAQTATGIPADRGAMALAIGRRLLAARPEAALGWFARAAAAEATPRARRDALAQAIAWIDPARHPALAAPLQQQLADATRSDNPLARIDALEALAATRARLGDRTGARALYGQALAMVSPALWPMPGTPEGDPALAARWRARITGEMEAVSR